jgi:hypothetical protein
MSANNEMFLRMREDDFNNLDNDTRALFTYVEVRESKEWENHKDDVKYLAYKKAERKAKEETQKYLFELRHK